MDRVAREKLKWKCRQGLLELDLVLARGARVHYRAGQDVRADLRAFLDDAYADLVSAFDGKLLQADRRGEAGGACAHHDYVILHRFTFSQFSTLF
jgi:succinate dehydrogenase flavin-adding protein (antitoxin of CptAB toxin-antitoxin module)